MGISGLDHRQNIMKQELKLAMLLFRPHLCTSQGSGVMTGGAHTNECVDKTTSLQLTGGETHSCCSTWFYLCICVCVCECRREKAGRQETLPFQLASLTVIYTNDMLMDLHTHSTLVDCVSWKLSFKFKCHLISSSLLRSLQATLDKADSFIL